MDEQVNKIRAEIERRYNYHRDHADDWAGTSHFWSANEDKEILSFIDSLQEEPKTDWLQELQDKLGSLSKEDFKKVMAKYSRYGEEGSVDYNKLNTMLDESLSTETKESWNKRLGEEPVSDYLEEEIDKYIKDNFTIDTEQLDRFGIEEKDYMYSMDKSDILAMVSHFTNWQKKQMMKDAVELTVKEGERGEPYLIYVPDVESRRLKVGDKIKLIIIKM